MSYHIVSTKQLAFVALLICILTISGIEINNIIKEYYSLPEVVIKSSDNSCIKVINYKNGESYNCQDVDIILRNYRKVVKQE
jgi:tRNA U34 5-carboxymethylaminomethyl modifying enzyme MnmG/GidA